MHDETENLLNLEQARLEPQDAAPTPLGAAPVYLQIAEEIRAQIMDGKLGPGEALPGTRTMATQFGVSYVTVHRALQVLIKEKLLHSSERSRTLVSQRFDPQAAVEKLANLPESGPFEGFEKTARLSQVQSVATHAPDPELFPIDSFFADVHMIARTDPWVLFHSEAAGEKRLRSVYAKQYSKEGLPTKSSQMSMASIVQAHGALIGALSQGKPIVIEQPYSLWAEKAFSSSSELKWMDNWGSIPNLNQLEDAFRAGSKLAIVSSTGCFTGGAPWNAQVRKDALQLADRYGAQIIERCSTHRFSYTSKSPKLLAEADSVGVVWTLDLVPHVLAPSIHIAFIRAPMGHPLSQEIVPPQTLMSYCNPIALAVGSMVKSGRWDEHVRRCSRVYSERQSALLTQLQLHTPHGVQFHPSQSGLAFYLQLPHEVDSAELYRASIEAKTAVIPGEFLSRTGDGRKYVRIVFSLTDVSKAGSAAKRIATALRKFC